MKTSVSKSNGRTEAVKNNATAFKITSPEFKALVSRVEVRTLADIFDGHGYELRIAGGAVRDFLNPLREMVPHDIDFATDATPQQMKEMFTKGSCFMI